MSVRQGVQLSAVAAVLLVSNVASAAPPPAAAASASAVGVTEAGERVLLRTTDLVAPVTVEGPLLEPPASTSVPVLAPVPETLDVAGIPGRAVAAYQAAEQRLAQEKPGCRLPWQLVAAIGYIESGHGSFRGAAIAADGIVAPPILGPRLDGAGAFALIRDTDDGALDGDTALDRAVGPMQFIPSTWARHGADGDSDGRTDPHDLDDAALAAGRYLCTSTSRLDQPARRIPAVFSYNHSYDYVRVVLTVAARYTGVSPSRYGVGLVPAPAPTASPAPSVSPSPSASPEMSAAPESSPEPQTEADPETGATPGGSPDPSASPELSDSPAPPPEPDGSPEPSGSPTPVPQAPIPGSSPSPEAPPTDP